VSTREQDEDVQRKAIEEFARARSIKLINSCIDKGESSVRPFRKRPGSSQLLKDIEVYKPYLVIA